MNRSRDNDILTENCVNYSFLYFSWWRAFLRLVYFCPWNHSSMPFFISLPLNNSFKYLTDLLKTHSVTYNKIITIKVAILVIVWWKTCFNYAFQGYSGFFFCRLHAFWWSSGGTKDYNKVIVMFVVAKKRLKLNEKKEFFVVE